MPDYRVRVETVMEGWVEVSADSEEEARRYAPAGVSSGDIRFDGDCMSIIAHEVRLLPVSTPVPAERSE